MKKLFLFSLVLLGFAAGSFAQDTKSATATAVVITPITLTKNVDMNFGNIAVSGTGGTVVLPAAAAPTRTITGGVTLPAVTGAVAAAKFTVTGEGTSTYSITLPSTDYTITRVSGSETMTVNTFISTPTTTGTLAAGTQDLYVGATLNVAANQVAGTYTNATGFDVTVNYN